MTKLTKDEISRKGRDLANKKEIRKVEILVYFKDGVKVHYDSDFDKESNWL